VMRGVGYPIVCVIGGLGGGKAFAWTMKKAILFEWQKQRNRDIPITGATTTWPK
jgi:hypothetical protein